MYIPGVNRLDDLSLMHAFMQANNFAIFVSRHNDELVATHLPLTLARQDGTFRFWGHFAKANPQWKTLADQEALVIFPGPHAYISPTHYDKHESVPTWNYVTVHAYGNVEIVRAEDEAERLETMLTEMITAHEVAYLSHWRGLDIRYREGMKQGIVGFELLVTRIQGKAKLSQNKSHSEQERIAEALLQSSNSEIAEVGYIMRDGFASSPKGERTQG